MAGKRLLNRLLGLAVVAVIAVGGLGITTASAQDEGTAWLGVSVGQSPDGVVVSSVYPGSPAEDADLQVNDLITHVDDTVIENVNELIETVQAYAPGDEVTLAVVRDGESMDVDVTLGERPTDLPTGGEAMVAPLGGVLNFLGMRAAMTGEGLEVRSIDANSPLADTDLQEGDIIVEIDGQSIDELTPGDLIQTLAGSDTLTLSVLRDGEQEEIEVDTTGLALPPMMTPGDVDVMPGPMMSSADIVLDILGLDAEMTDAGLVVNAIAPDSPLADSDLQAGDVITEVDGVAVDDLNPALLSRYVADGETMTLSVERDGEAMDIEVEMPALFQTPSDMMAPGFGMNVTPNQPPSQLGVQYQMITVQLAREQELPTEEGALLVQVFPGTPAATAGLQVNDIVTAVDGDMVDQERTLSDRLYAYEEGDVVTLTILRDGEELDMHVTLGPAMRQNPANVPGRPGVGPFGQGFSFPEGRGPRGPMQGFHDGSGMMPDGHHMHDFFEMMPDGQHMHDFFEMMPDAEHMQEFFEMHPFLSPDNTPSMPDTEAAPSTESSGA